MKSSCKRAWPNSSAEHGAIFRRRRSLGRILGARILISDHSCHGEAIKEEGLEVLVAGGAVVIEEVIVIVGTMKRSQGRGRG